LATNNRRIAQKGFHAVEMIRGFVARMSEATSGSSVAIFTVGAGLRLAQSGLRLLPRGRAMKLHYYPETDSLYIELTNEPGAEAREIVEGLVVDFDADDNIVGLDIDHASRKLDLSKVETIALPPASAAE
jgi:uncharacterized protein YuzE